MSRSVSGTAALLVLALAGCGGADPGSSSTVPPPPSPSPAASKTALGTTWVGDLKLELLADATLATGLETLYVRATRAGAPVTDAALTVTPVMTLAGGNSQHSCPLIGAPTVGADGLYRVRVVFQHPTGMMGHWDVYAAVTPPGGTELMGKFLSVPVAESGRAAELSYTAPGTSVVMTYVASLGLQAPPVTGMNPVEVTFHRMDGPMIFTPITDASITLEPRQPAVGPQVAPGSVAPTYVADGVYEGALALPTTGTWETTVTFSRGAETIGAPVFTAVF